MSDIPALPIASAPSGAAPRAAPESGATRDPTAPGDREGFAVLLAGLVDLAVCCPLVADGDAPAGAATGAEAGTSLPVPAEVDRLSSAAAIEGSEATGAVPAAGAASGALAQAAAGAASAATAPSPAPLAATLGAMPASRPAPMPSAQRSVPEPADGFALPGTDVSDAAPATGEGEGGAETPQGPPRPGTFPGLPPQAAGPPGEPGAEHEPRPAATRSEAVPLSGPGGGALTGVGAQTPAPVESDPDLRLEPPVGHARWGAALVDRVTWLVEGDVKHARLQLNPPDLGPLDIHVTVVEEETRVSFSAPHAVVREALEAALPRLREMLGAGGLNLVHVDVSAGGRESRPDAREGSGSAGPSRAGVGRVQLSARTAGVTQTVGLFDAYA